MNENVKTVSHEELIGGLGRERIFRERRFDGNKLKNINYLLLIRVDGKQIPGKIENFSTGGMAIKVSALDFEIKDNNRVELILSVNGDDFYSGGFLIRTISHLQDGILLRGEFTDSIFEVEKIFNLNLESQLKHTIESKIQYEIDAYTGHIIKDEYKREIKKFADFLCIIKDLCEDVQKKIEKENLAHPDTLLQSIHKYICEKFSPVYEGFIDRLYHHTCNLSPEERNIYRAYTQRELKNIALESPFCHRAFYKPLGYAGDYECMRILIRGMDEGKNLYEKFLNHSVSSLKMAKMVRSRGQFIKRKIIDYYQQNEKEWKRNGAMKVMSIACGPSEELADLVDDNNFQPSVPIIFYLVDQDDKALDYSMKKLKPKFLQKSNFYKGKFFHVSIKQIIQEADIIEKIGNADFIYTMGMMDYMPEWIAGRIIESLFKMLSKNGVMYIGNIRPGIETSWISEFLFHWELNFRTGEDLLKLSSCLPGNVQKNIEAEELGFNLFLTVKNV